MPDETKSVLPLMLASAGAGMIARIPCHPIDTCKSRLQVQTDSAASSKKLYKNVFDAFSRIARTEGVFGLYRGFGITFLGSAPASMIYFTSYELSKKELSEIGWLKQYGFVADFSAGLFAEAISCVLWVPIDVLKERMQIQKHRASTAVGASASEYYASSFDAVQKVIRNEGLSGIYKGYGATLLSFGPFSALYFMFYEQLKQNAMRFAGTTQESDTPGYYFLMCGAGAGAFASLITNPLDLVKLRLQVQRATDANAATASSKGHAIAGAGAEAKASALPTFRYKGMVDGLATVWKQEGPLALFKGAGARMLFHAPATAISIAAFEQLKIVFGA
jgi:hypothetical protein